MKARSPWLSIRSPLSGRRAVALKFASFLLPLAAWCAVSYVPWIWHPMIHVTDGGDSDFLLEDMLINKADFAEESAKLAASQKALPHGYPANPIFLPAPHQVARAFYAAFTTPPFFPNDPWLHESLWHSAQIIFWGFLLAAVTGVPIGILCGTFDLFSKLCEPFVDFIRYMPYPMFGALCVTILGIDTAPKIAIIWIGLFFQTVLIVANTTRNVDTALLEAAQTLGATRKSLIPKVILPAIMPNLYNDLRILLGSAWTILIIAELIGAASGISYFINQQGKYRHFDNVYAGMLMIGIIGLSCDQFLAAAAPVLFPWLPGAEKRSVVAAAIGAFTFMPQRAILRRRAERSAERRARAAELAEAGAAPAGPAAAQMAADHREPSTGDVSAEGVPNVHVA